MAKLKFNSIQGLDQIDFQHDEGKFVTLAGIEFKAQRVSPIHWMTLHDDTEYATTILKREISTHATLYDAQAFEILAVMHPKHFGYQAGFSIVLVAFYKKQGENNEKRIE